MRPNVDARRWAEALATFDEVVELGPAARAERLAALGAIDAELRGGVETLLAADAAIAASGRTADPLGLVGRTVSHFRILEPLAQGGMGIVYQAEDTRLNRRVALKFPLGGHELDRRMKERFLHEARLAGALDHPNLCAIYEAGETDDGHLFHAMPLYAGETLKARLARDGALQLTDALATAKQIAHGLSAAHRAGIVHRDLKPANVMLLPDGTVKILDFGLARALDLGLTPSRATLGTVSYMAPEQIEGKPLDGRADLWALGVVLYETLTGRRPFEGESAGAVSHAILNAEPPHPSALRNDVGVELDEVVCTLLHKDPAERPASAEDVAMRLAVVQLVDSGVVGAWPRLARTRRWPVRARMGTAAAIVVGITAIGFGAWRTFRDAGNPPVPRVVAVLPFRQPSDGADTRHLAAGIADAIATELSRLRGVVVPSQVSTSAVYRSSRSLSEVASTLAAFAVVTGSVTRVGDSVRVDVQLVDARSNRELWRSGYTRALGDVLDIQRSAAGAIVSALDIDVTSAERAMLERPATANASAYDHYLRGREVELRDLPRDLGARIPTEHVRLAQSFYSRAREMDPAFAIARARLALMLMQAALTYDTTTARREHARLEAEEALRLQPGLAEAHLALARYWSAGGLDYAKATEQLERALDGSPNRVEVHLRLGDSYRSMGRWEDAVAAYERAEQLDPRNVHAATQLAFTYTRLRRHAEAIRAYDRAIDLSQDDRMLRVIRGHTYLRWQGSPDTLAAVLRSAPPDWDPNGMATWARYTVLRVERRDADALAMLDASQSALSRDGLVYQPTALMRGQCWEALGDRAKARTYYETARAMLDDSVAARPRDASIRVVLALALASSGRSEEAVREARRAMEMVPLSRNSPGATAFMGVAVEVFARVGDMDTAFELLELLMAMPAGREATVAFLRVWPGFDPLRSDPRFASLLVRFAEG